MGRAGARGGESSFYHDQREEARLSFVNPFEIAGNWYRGNLHAHSTNSDGWLSPELLVRAYQRGGMDFLAITDHWKITNLSAQSSESFLILPGAEFHTGVGTNGQDRLVAGEYYHVVGIGITENLSRDAGLSAQQLVDGIRAQGGYAVLAHPYYSGLSQDEMLAVEGCAALEVFNTVCEVMIDRGHSMVHWDDLLSRGRRVCAVASDDCHHAFDDSLQGWTVVKAPALTREHILKALEQGSFYASTGPELHDLRRVGDRIQVRCSPVRKIGLVSNPARGKRVIAREGEALTEASLPLPANVGYARVQVTDSVGRMAWAGPTFL